MGVRFMRRRRSHNDALMTATSTKYVNSMRHWSIGPFTVMLGISERICRTDNTRRNSIDKERYALLTVHSFMCLCNVTQTHRALISTTFPEWFGRD